MINTSTEALKDPRVRQALALAVDRKVLSDAALGGVQAPAASFTPPGIMGYEPPQAQKLDIERARTLLAEAGFPGGKGLPRIEVLYVSSENHARVAEVLQAMWQQNLGVEVALRNEEWTSYYNSRDTGSFQIAQCSWIADYPAPAAFLETLTSWSGNNYSEWRNPNYDRLIKQAENARVDEERNKAYANAEALLLQEAPVIPLYHYQTVYLIRPEVKGWHPTPLDWHPYKYVSLEAAE
jgi:oligopeptide transport system substrate-binding protein